MFTHETERMFASDIKQKEVNVRTIMYILLTVIRVNHQELKYQVISSGCKILLSVYLFFPSNSLVHWLQVLLLSVRY